MFLHLASLLLPFLLGLDHSAFFIDVDKKLVITSSFLEFKRWEQNLVDANWFKLGALLR